MKEHQRYFEVRNDQGMLLPHFISARNGDRVKLKMWFEAIKKY